jgi:hypothetical protein
MTNKIKALAMLALAATAMTATAQEKQSGGQAACPL